MKIGTECSDLAITLALKDDDKWKQMIMDGGGTIYYFTVDEQTQFKTKTAEVVNGWVARCKDAGYEAEAKQIMHAIGFPGY